MGQGWYAYDKLNQESVGHAKKKVCGDRGEYVREMLYIAVVHTSVLPEKVLRTR